LHTSSAIETFVRLFDMGLERYVVASALNGMLAQRLVRRVCTQCRKATAVSDDMRSVFDSEGIAVDHIYEATGCEACNQTGYAGRTGLFELIIADDALKDLVKADTLSRVELAQRLLDRGHHGLRREALVQVAQGVTTMDEAYRVT
jgi:type IV pilus assembly protein PilB